MSGCEVKEGGLAILLCMFHAKETGISSGRLGLWLLSPLPRVPDLRLFKVVNKQGMNVYSFFSR